MNNDRLGYYRVGFKKFYNKTLALLENHRTGYEVEWIFNDNVYDFIDWTKPIETHLLDLYKQRAQQLRDKYDYLVLYFSGGADSTNILHAFVDNNIFLDEIVMQFPEPVVTQFNEEDKSNKNIYSEIKYQAVPTLNGIKLPPLTKVRYQDFAKPLLELLNNDNWFDIMPLGTNISPSGIGRQVAQVKEEHILNLCEKGKTAAQILGVDKPLVYSDGDNYFAYFSDVSAMHSPPVDFTQSEVFNKLYRTEFFYWTPDLPEIVVKQAQLIKQFCITNHQAKDMIMQSMKKHIQHYRGLLHSIIYPRYVKIDWDPEKPTSEVVRPMDNWFWEMASTQIKENYLNTIDYLENNTNSKYMIKNNIHNGLAAHKSKFYKL
jgi:hypothetical protein